MLVEAGYAKVVFSSLEKKKEKKKNTLQNFKAILWF